MSVKRHAILSFGKIRQGDLAPLATNIVDLMTANADVFPNPPVPLADVTKLIAVYLTAYNKADHASKKGEVYHAREALEAALKKLGMYVNEIADGDEEILEKSGFPLSKVPSSHKEIPAPTEMGAEINADGGFDLWATLVDKAYNGVLFAFTEVSNPEKNPYNWTLRYSPTPEITISDSIVRGKEYKFAVAFEGSSEVLHWGVMGKTLFAN